MKPGSIIFEPEKKWQSKEWHHPQSPRKNDLRNSASGKVKITDICECEQVLLVDAMPREETVKSDAFIRRLKELRKLFKRLEPQKTATEILLQLDNGSQHRSLEDSGSHKNILDSFTSVQPTSPI
jgi:hypothetical protein